MVEMIIGIISSVISDIVMNLLVLVAKHGGWQTRGPF